MWAAVAAGVVLWIRWRTGRTGLAIGVTGLLYGLGRFVLDGFRADAIRFGLTGSRWTGLILILVSLGVLVVAAVRSDRNEVDDAPVEVDA